LVIQQRFCRRRTFVVYIVLHPFIDVPI